MSAGVCQSCGACCAALRVPVGLDELDSEPGGAVPAGLVDRFSGNLGYMRGTDRQPSRCVALQGEIGKRVRCAIYEFRPAACRDFAPLAALGRGGGACDDARRRHRLTLLK